jgi:hypothetical protein
MANPWEEEYEEEGPWNEEFEQAEQPSAESTPFPYEPKTTPTRYGGLVPRGGELEKKKIADSGVDVTSGAPDGVRTGYEAFAVNEGAFNDFLQKEFHRVMGPDAEVRKGPVSNKPEYWDPKTQRWTLVSHSSIGQEIISHAGEALNTVGGLASLAGPNKGSAVKETLSAAAKGGSGTMGTDWFRMKIGDWLGVNDTSPGEGERIGEAAKAGGMAAGGEMLGGLGYGISKYIIQSVKGKPVFTPEEAQQLLDGMGKYDDVIKDINDNSDVDFTTFLHQRVDPNLPAASIAERWYSLLSESSDPNIRLKVAQARANQYGALRSYYLKANEPHDVGIPPTAEGREAAGQSTKQGIEQARQEGMAEVEGRLQGLETQGRQMVEALPANVNVTAEQAGRAMRDQMFAKSQESKALVNEAYKRYNDLISYNSRTGQSPYMVEIKDPGLVKIIEDFRANSLTGLKSGSVVPNYVYEDGLRAVPPGKGAYATGANGNGIKVDLGTLDMVAKNIAEAARDKTVNKENVAVRNLDLVKAESDIHRVIKDYIQKGSLDGTLPEETFLAYQTARAEAKRDAYLFKEGFLADFLEKDRTHNWVLKDRDVVTQILRTKDLEAAKQIKEFVEGDPVAMREMKKVLFSLYHKKATKKGLPSAELHDKFMADDQYGPIMDIFFKNEDFDKLASYKDVAQSLASTAKQAKTIEKELRSTLGGKITKWSSENLVKSVLSSSLDSASTRKMMAVSMRTSGLKGVKDLKNGVMNEIQMRVFPQGLDGEMSYSALDQVIDKYGGNIDAVLGPKYLEQLRTLRKTAPMLMRNPAKVGDPPVMTRLQQAVRGVIRPMSREGNFMSFLRQNRGANLPASIWDALTDINELEKLANYTKAMVQGTRASATAGGQVGVQTLNEQQDYIE